MNEEQKLRKSEANKRYRQRKKAERLGLPIPDNLLIVRRTKEEKQAYKNELDRQWRANKTPEKREEYLKKERDRKKSQYNKKVIIGKPIKPERLDNEAEIDYSLRLKQYKRDYDKFRYYSNLEYHKKKNANYKKKNSERISLYNKAYTSANAQAISVMRKKYKKENASSVRSQRRSYYFNKRKDPGFVALITLRVSFRHILNKYLSGDKVESVSDLVGCTMEEFVQYIQDQFMEGMTWTPKNFHLDHIRPCSSFDFNDIEKRKACFHYTNFQPLWPIDNLRKHAKLDWKTEEK